MNNLQDTPQNRAVAREIALRNADEDMSPASIYGDENGDISIILECDKLYDGEFCLADEYDIDSTCHDEVWAELERLWQEYMDAMEDEAEMEERINPPSIWATHYDA